MPSTLTTKLNWLQQLSQVQLLTKLQHGIEKEGLRVDNQRQLAQTAHPKTLGSALTHPYITTDYSEALLEFITPVFKQSSAALDFLADLHRFSYMNMPSENIWPSSMPCDLPSEENIPIANYGSSNIGQMKHIYRHGLAWRYGKAMQTIAGIHYNFSLPEDFWLPYQKYSQNNENIKNFRSESYFCLIRNFRRYSWLLSYLFGASPALCRSFLHSEEHPLESLSKETLYLPYATSLRMSDLGYSNKTQAQLNICFNHLDTYIKSLKDAIHTPHPAYQKIGVKVNGNYRQLNTNILQIENEYYSDIRPKPAIQSGEKPVDALSERGVQYIEVRNTDINPFLPLGIDQAQSDFLDLFLISCLLMDERLIDSNECDQIKENHQRIVTQGRDPELLLLRNNNQQITVKDWGQNLLDRMLPVAELLDQTNTGNHFTATLKQQSFKLNDPELTPSAKVLAKLREQKIEYSTFIFQQAEKHKKYLLETPVKQETLDQLTSLSKISLEQQQAIEAGEKIDFDNFLHQYMSNP